MPIPSKKCARIINFKEFSTEEGLKALTSPSYKLKLIQDNQAIRITQDHFFAGRSESINIKMRDLDQFTSDLIEVRDNAKK